MGGGITIECVFLNVGRLVNPDGLFVGIVMTLALVIVAVHVSESRSDIIGSHDGGTESG